MTPKHNDGPAFPFGQTDSMSGQLVNGWGSEGMTLREYFAAMAMQGYVSAGSTGMPPAGEIARLAVVTADALLEELDKGVT